ncbi:fungal-specific transcription factor domain-containing protein [Ilyonectria sp. MPI-CAGE-AT-0026]|nr:fungal-specific transcription factor domain-containing protein [Ilyonectria sp. MPI-CAGE-AT-0026]
MPTSVKGAACGTCRKKCRKCGRERPSCSQCTAKGDVCEGYPLKFCGVASRGRLSGKLLPVLDSPRPNKIRRTRRTDVSSSTIPSIPEFEEPSLDLGSASTPTNHSSPISSTPNTSPDIGLSLQDNQQEKSSTFRDTVQPVDEESPLSIASCLSRDDELLLPLDAVSGTKRVLGQRVLVGMKTYFSSSIPVQETQISRSEVPSFSRMTWASRIAAVKFDALPSLSPPLDTASLPTNLDQERVQFLLQYFDESVCPKLVVDDAASWSNPFQQYLLPLSLQFSGVLYAVLGLSLGHLSINHYDTLDNEQEALEYRFMAIRQLIDWLEGLDNHSTDPCLVEAGLAIILILVLHDVCETGVSAGGIHLNGVTSICRRHSELLKSSLSDRPCMTFLFGALSWLHMLRCIPRTYETLLPDSIREASYQEMCPRLFESFSGCPLNLFLKFSRLLESSRDLGIVDEEGRKRDSLVRSIREEIRVWRREEPDGSESDPTGDYLANAFRHSFLLHSLRTVDKSLPAESPEIQTCINDILNMGSKIAVGFKGSRRLFWPLFMAGTEATMPYQHDYILIRINSIIDDTGFRNLASTTILERIWKERTTGLGDGVSLSVPWTDHLSRPGVTENHDYLIF